MEQAPDYGSPYQLLAPDATNHGSQGVRIAWDGMRYFYGQVINEAWQDLQNVQGLGVEIV
jgi:hypothetical protein